MYVHTKSIQCIVAAVTTVEIINILRRPALFFWNIIKVLTIIWWMCSIVDKKNEKVAKEWASIIHYTIRLFCLSEETMGALNFFSFSYKDFFIII